MPKKCLIMKVTNDEYELPLIVADTIKEMAQICGTTESAIKGSIHNHKIDKWKNPHTSIFVTVDMDKDFDYGEQ